MSKTSYCGILVKVWRPHYQSNRWFYADKERRKKRDKNYAYFPVVFEEDLYGASRAEVFTALEKNGISARKYFYPLTNTFECFHGKYDVTQTPVALHISQRVLTLPLYADLAPEDVDRICSIVLSCRT